MVLDGCNWKKARSAVEKGSPAAEHADTISMRGLALRLNSAFSRPDMMS
jgi:hypothetical protein